MKRGQTLSTIIVLAAVAAGCRTTEPEPPPPDPSKVEIKIESDPVGAKIYHGAGATTNRATPTSYLGTTPFVWKTTLDKDGQLQVPRIGFVNSFGPQAWLILEAQPPDTCTNCSAKRWTYRPGALMRDGDKVPTALFFDLKR